MANLDIENIESLLEESQTRQWILNQYIHSQGKEEKDFTKRLTFTLFDRTEI